MNEPRIGAHVSTGGGLPQAVHNARAIGADGIQIFGCSPVRWKAALPDEETITEFKNERKAQGISFVFLHAPYLINLASEKRHIRALSKKLLADNLLISNLLGADGVIFHTGSAGAIDSTEAILIASQAIREIFSGIPEGRLIVENSAGGGNLIGDTIDEVAGLIKEVGSPRFDFCLDTAHALASGMVQSYETEQVLKLEQEIREKIGIEKLAALHVNDSKFAANTKRDRHENIGEGFVGMNGFKNLFKSDLFRSVPLILEVPGFSGNGPDEENIKRLREAVG